MANLPLERSHNQTTRYNFDRIAERLGPLTDLIRFGNGTPEGSVAGRIGTVYFRLDGASGTSIYTKVSGAETSTTLWEAMTTSGSIGNHDLLSATHPDTTPASVVRGDIVTGQAGPTWARKALGTSGYFVSSDGTAW